MIIAVLRVTAGRNRTRLTICLDTLFYESVIRRICPVREGTCPRSAGAPAGDRLCRPVQCGEVFPHQDTLVKRKGLARAPAIRRVGLRISTSSPSTTDSPSSISLGTGMRRFPEKVRSHWGPMIETYLRERETLRLVLLILDIRRDPSEEDHQLIGWMQYYRLPFLVVLTKIDKVSRNQCAERQRQIGSIWISLRAAGPFVLRENGRGKGPPLEGDQKRQRANSAMRADGCRFGRNRTSRPRNRPPKNRH